MELTISCSVLYLDNDGRLQSRTLRPTVCMETQIAENVRCSVTQVSSGELFCTAGNGGISIRVPVRVSVDSYAEHAIRAVSGAEVTPSADPAGRRPAVLLRLTDKEESIWEVAKCCRTSTQLIAEANDLSGSSIPAGTLLLIPM